MRVKKLFSLLAFIGVAATAIADDVTFDLVAGSDDVSWKDGQSWTNLQTGGVWQKNPGTGSWLRFEAKASGQLTSTYIQGYTITLGSSNKTDGQLPYSWTLYGSNDLSSEENWVIIHQQAQANNIVDDFDANANINNKTYTFYCNSSTKYKYYKFNITGKLRGGWGCFQISGFNLIPSSEGFSAASTSNGMDGKTETILSGAAPQTITVNGTGLARMTGFQFTTGDNSTNTGRNPKTIKVEGSTDGSSYTTIEMKTGYTGLADKDYYPYVFQCYGPQNYRYYRFTFDDVVTGTTFQMSELAIITESCTSHASYSSEGFCKKCLSPEETVQDGSSNYLITNAGKFVSFAQIVNSGTPNAKGKLTADIDLTNVSWTPIGTSTNKYTGTFDGQLHSVTLNMTNTSEACQGLFGYATGGANFKNFVIKGIVKGNGNCAALVGQTGGDGESGTITISRVGCEVDVTSGGDRNGAFVGNPWGGVIKMEVENSYNSGKVSSTGTWYSVMGGWRNVESTFTNVYNIGDAGKFVCEDKGVCTNCYTTGSGSQTGLTKITSAKVTSGELCYLLNGDQSDINFYQTIGTGHPVFDSSKPNVYKIAVGSALYASFVPKANIAALPTGVTAYAGQISGDWLHLEQVSQLPANAAVIVKAQAAGNFYCNSTTESRSLGTDNDLTSSAEAFSADGTQYCLANKEPGVGFYQVQSGITIPARKVYLTVSSPVKAFYGFEEDDADGINSLTPALSEGKGAIYNLAGQRVSRMQKGINIVNGKKVLF